MTDVAVTLFIIFLTLVLNEYLWRKKLLHGEAARKFVHILIGMWGAFWPFYLEWAEIVFICALAVAFFGIMRIVPYFKSFYDIKRKSYGDIIGPATIGLLALIQPSVWVFTAAVLHIALADGFAAVIGTKYGWRRQYKILGNIKSIIGTAVFWTVSLGILASGAILAEPGLNGLSLFVLLWLSAGAAYLENISPFGLDNLFVPLLIVAVLQPLQ